MATARKPRTPAASKPTRRRTTTKPKTATAGADTPVKKAAKAPAKAAATPNKPAVSPVKPAAPASEAPPPAAPSPEETEARMLPLTRKDLFDKITETTGVKRRFVRPVVEAVLQELGDALENGAELHLKPFGKAKVHRTNEQANTNVLLVKLRRPKQQAPSGGGEDPLAEAAE